MTKMEILPNDISKILRDLYNFYPIGAEILNRDYAGYKKLEQIVAKKINSMLVSGNGAICPGLAEAFEHNFSEYAIVTEYEKQFPNYAISIILDSVEDNSISVSTCIKIRISLLSKFYTYFVEEQTIDRNLSESTFSFRPLTSIVVSSNSSVFDPDRHFGPRIENILNPFLKDYYYIAHDLLLNQKIRFGNPVGFEIAGLMREFSLYDFLFDNEYCNIPNIIVNP